MNQAAVIIRAVAKVVAQVSNPLNRRVPIGKVSPALLPLDIQARCRLEALRYSRLETCATFPFADLVHGPAVGGSR